MVMDSVRVSMSNTLSTECDRLGGTWINTPYDSEKTQNVLFQYFYDETGANTNWGYCADKSSVMENNSG